LKARATADGPGTTCRLPNSTVPISAIPMEVPSRWEVPRIPLAVPASPGGTVARTKSWLGAIVMPVPSPASSSGPARSQPSIAGAVRWITTMVRARPISTIVQPSTTPPRPGPPREPAPPGGRDQPADRERRGHQAGGQRRGAEAHLPQDRQREEDAAEAAEERDGEDRAGGERGLPQQGRLEQRVAAAPVNAPLPGGERGEYDHTAAETDPGPGRPAILPPLHQGNEQEQQPAGQQPEPDRVEAAPGVRRRGGQPPGG